VAVGAGVGEAVGLGVAVGTGVGEGVEVGEEAGAGVGEAMPPPESGVGDGLGLCFFFLREAAMTSSSD
jgi:hypothetical protein